MHMAWLEKRGDLFRVKFRFGGVNIPSLSRRTIAARPTLNGANLRMP